MKIFLFCCLSLILFADAADTNFDTEDFADESLEALVDKKSDTKDSAVDEDRREEQDLDLKIIKDILSGDKESLQEDLQERQTEEDEEDEGFPAFLTAVGLGTADILREATRDVSGNVISLIDSETDGLRYRRKKRYFCRLSRRLRPGWLRLLKDVFPEVDEYLDETCQH